MAAVYGEFSADKLYTLQQVASMLDQEPDWVREHLVVPTHARTGQAILDDDGEPLHGVAHVRVGNVTLIPGQSMIAWAIKHAKIVAKENRVKGSCVRKTADRAPTSHRHQTDEVA